MGLQRGVVRRLSCRTAPLDPEPRQGSFLAIGLIEFDDSSVNSTKNNRAFRSHADTEYQHGKCISTLKLTSTLKLCTAPR